MTLIPNVSHWMNLTPSDCSRLGIPAFWVGKRMNTARLITIRANLRP